MSASSSAKGADEKTPIGLRAAAWAGLLALTAALTLLFEGLGLPAARFLGPMDAALIFSISGARLALPNSVFTFAKGMLGVRIAQSVGPDFFGVLGGSWPFLAAGTLWAMAAAGLLGVFLTRRKIMPGTTSIWGLSPGGASVMTLMSADFGGDMQMVALMQYTRVVLVSLAAIFVSRLFAPPVAIESRGGLFLPFSGPDLMITILCAIAALWIAEKTKFPGGAIVVPMIVLALVKNCGGVAISLPVFVLVPCYIVIGWRIGGNFSRESLKRAVSIYHWILLAVIAMTGLCGAFGWIMFRLGGFDALTAYLATSPGGLDVVTIIAAGTGASLSFIAAMQTLRLFAVIILGPFLARLCIRLAGHGPPEPQAGKAEAWKDGEGRAESGKDGEGRAESGKDG
jgi:membrane AbrB-like protein